MKLAIDKITVGFRPILVKVNNKWKHLTKKGLGRWYLIKKKVYIAFL